MNRISRIAALGVVLLSLPAGRPARAHELGVTTAELTERADGGYVLVVRAPPALAHLFGAPELPGKCRFAEPSAPAGGRGGVLRFEWSCDEALTASDVLRFDWKREGIVLNVRWKDGTEVSGFFRRGQDGFEIPLNELSAGSGSFADAARRYTVVGIGHILMGPDHLLFVAGLLLLVSGAMRLVKTITAFTVAHSITLALATLGVVNVPTRPVDAAVALSIVFVATEIVHARRGEVGLSVRHPWVVSFLFGLLHGLGFAGALSNLGLPRSEIPAALLFFNVGVEIGQLMFVLAFLAARWAIRVLSLSAPRWVAPVPTYVLGTLATYWFFRRVLIVFGV